MKLNTLSEWTEYLTIDNYFSINQIENRTGAIEESGIDFSQALKGVKSFRSQNKKILFEFSNRSFYITETTKLNEYIENINKFFKNSTYAMKNDIASELLAQTLIEEGFYSSTIEGANTTIKQAQDLSNEKQTPKNKSDFMVLNNFFALKELEKKSNDITDKLICDIHKITVENTLEESYLSGEYRKEQNEIRNQQQKVIFTPPNIADMKDILDGLIKFTKKSKTSAPIDSVSRAVAFHFLFSFIHPFDDGNGRVVRILTAYLLKHYGYDMFYYISISEIINKDNAKKYYQAFIDVERSDKNKKDFDMTYFFYYVLGARC